MKQIRNNYLAVCCIVLLLIVFIIDINFASDLPFLLLYLLPLFISSLRFGRKYLVTIAFLASICICAGAFLPEYIPAVLPHRIVEIGILWFAYLILKQRMKTEKELKGTNKLLETILDNTNLYFAYMDKDFNFIKVNKAYAEVDEKDTTYFRGRNHFDLYPNKENEEIFKNVVKTGKPYFVSAKPFIFEKNPERGVTYWDWSLIPVKDSNGKIEGLLMSLANVTDQFKTKQQVNQFHTLLEALYSSLNEAVFFINPDTMLIEDCNYAAEKIFGYAKNELIGKDVSIRHVDLNSYNKFHQNILESNDKKSHFETEYQMKRKDGSVFASENYVTPVYDDNGKHIITVSIVRDITERKQFELDLKSQQSLLKAVFDNLPVGVWLTDEKGEIIFGNPAGQKVWEGAKYVGVNGYHEYKGWWFDSGEPIEPEQWSAARAVKNGETSLNEKIKIQCFDESYKIILNSSVPIKSDEGKITGAIVVNQDITEEMENQEKLKMTLTDLERSNKELEHFAYVSSHDLQEPLRMVSTYTTLLERKYGGLFDSTAKKYMEFVVDGAKRMQMLIQDLLQYTRIQNKDRALSDVDCMAVICKTLDNLSLQIGETSAIIRYDNLPVIKADPILLTQVFQNLISNAIKFRSTGTPEILINCKERGTDWLFSVKDNGIGIDPAYFDKIFVIFQRLHGKNEYPGTGIGLSICKKIIEQHSGEIWVESEVGRGSTFYFTIAK